MQVSHAVGAVAAVVGLLAGIVSPEGVVATAVESKDVARVLASKKTLKVLLEDNRGEQQP
jgi:hypothetical protein